MKCGLFLFCILCLGIVGRGQSSVAVADSIRVAYGIPELAFAVVSADSVLECRTLGVQRVNTRFAARPGDRFHIGSNTKAITSFVAALLVRDGKISWDTRFLDMFPEFKSSSRKAYQTITLQDLLSFRGKLPRYTYTNDKPTLKQIQGNNHEQRLLLARYFLSQKPMKPLNGITPSNADYVLAGLMLEKASGKPYKQLVTDLGQILGIRFGFDYPNVTDTLQPWGHDANLVPVPPFDHYKLNWLLSAGNINVSPEEYVRFVQEQLKGLKGESTLLPAAEFERLLYGLPEFSFGWFNRVDAATGHHVANNEGNAGAFITQVEIIREADRGYIVFTNSYTPQTRDGIGKLMDYLQGKYGR